MKTYADHNPLYAIQQAYNEKTRMLMVHSYPLHLSDLKEALELVGRYNQFDPTIVFNSLSDQFGDTYEYIVGREYSPVIYIIPKKIGLGWPLEALLEVKTKVLADEISFNGDRLRLWWD